MKFNLYKSNSIQLIILIIIICILCYGLLYILYYIYNNYSAPNLVEIFESKEFPSILKYENVFTSNECNQIMALALPNLERSKLGAQQSIDNTRTSNQTWLKNDALPCIKRMSTFVSKLSQLPVANQEQWQILRYRPGQEYKPHYDSCNIITHDYADCVKEEIMLKWGKRVCTFFIYLNDVEDGGETYFTKLNKMYKPKQGNAIFWSNLTDDQLSAHPYSQHGGMPVKKGEKWAINVWVRQHPVINSPDNWRKLREQVPLASMEGHDNIPS